MKIVSFNKAKCTIGKKRGQYMYEGLVRELESRPAEKYVVREAERLADKVLEIGGYLGKSAPTPIVKIVNDFEFAAYKANNIPKDISGNIFIGGSTKKDYGKDKVIIVGADEDLPHQRFIIAHELAHYLMDYIGNDKYANNEYTFSKTYPKINHDSMEEIRADRFAAELLMPKKVFLAEYVKAMKRSDYSKEYTIPYLAELFKVKESCVKRRIQEVLEWNEGWFTLHMEEENQNKNSERSTHSRYTEAYIGILNTYKEQLSRSIKNKNNLKKSFFRAIRLIMYVMTYTFAGVIIISLILMGAMVLFDNSSVEIIAGAIVTIISSFVTMVLSIFKLPKIIADYLFNKEEDNQMAEIIGNIQKYELDAVKAEKLHDKAKVDAVAVMESSDLDLEMKDFDYVDSSNDNTELNQEG